jgi:hypothetical protein
MIRLDNAIHIGFIVVLGALSCMSVGLWIYAICQAVLFQ